MAIICLEEHMRNLNILQMFSSLLLQDWIWLNLNLRIYIPAHLNQKVWATYLGCSLRRFPIASRLLPAASAPAFAPQKNKTSETADVSSQLTGIGGNRGLLLITLSVSTSRMHKHSVDNRCLPSKLNNSSWRLTHSFQGIRRWLMLGELKRYGMFKD